MANACVCTLALGREPGTWRQAAPVWALLIIASTVTTKQHFVIDLPGGMALAAFSVWLVGRYVRVGPVSGDGGAAPAHVDRAAPAH